jgi:hypothetical protein
MHAQQLATLLLTLAFALPTNAGSSGLLRLRGGRGCVELKNIPTASAEWLSANPRVRRDAILLDVPIESPEPRRTRERASHQPPALVPASPSRAADAVGEDAEEASSSPTSRRAPLPPLLSFVGSLGQNWPSFAGNI